VTIKRVLFRIEDVETFGVLEFGELGKEGPRWRISPNLAR